MSRIGKTPVLIPEKVTVDFDGLTVTVKGPKGELKRLMPEGVSVDKKDNTVVVSPTTTKIYSRQRHGLCRALIANMVEGVTQGFSKKLEIVGGGSRAQVKGKNLVVSAGYSHPVEMIPSGYWQAAKSTGEFTLVSCCVGPGFDFKDFELLRNTNHTSRLDKAINDLI